MSDKTATPEHTTDKTNGDAKPAHAPRKRLIPTRWIVVLLLLIAVGIVVQQLVTLRFWELLGSQQSTQSAQIDTVDTRLAALEGAVAEQGVLRDDFRKMQAALKEERALLTLDRIEQQIDAGWQIWVGTGDPAALVNAMQTAQRLLAHDASAEGQALRLAVNHDLVAIKSQQTIDLRDAVERIDTVIASIDKLPFVQDRRVPQDTPDTAVVVAEVSGDTLLDRGRQMVGALAHELWNAIRGMIRVQRLDRAEAGLLAPEQKVFLQQGLRLLLLDARHALIMRNTAVYQQTLGQAKNWIQKYADASDALVKEDLTSLQSLATRNIDPRVVSLVETRQALAAARASITGEPLSVEADAALSTPPATMPESTAAASSESVKAPEAVKGATP